MRMQQYRLAGEHLLIHISPIINRCNHRLVDQLALNFLKFWTRQGSDRRRPIEIDDDREFGMRDRHTHAVVERRLGAKCAGTGRLKSEPPGLNTRQ